MRPLRKEYAIKRLFNMMLSLGHAQLPVQIGGISYDKSSFEKSLNRDGKL